jgi:hypothetical protein
MDIEILGSLGFAFAAIVLATRAYQRCMDVLYGSYIQGRAGSLSVKRFWQPASSAIDRLSSLEGRKMIYLASIGPVDWAL